MDPTVSSFYDGFAEKQVQTGINPRHRRIMDWLHKAGLRDGLEVLEIGCGVGTQTQLLAEALPHGKLLANDISERSVGLAKERLAGRQQVRFVTGDVVQLEIEGSFDLIVLPDVLEHIPLANHGALFMKLGKLLRPDGRVVIHIPAPQYLDWVIANHPEKLQVIDQPIHMNVLTPHLAAAGLYIHMMEHYSLWTDGPDAAVLVLKHYRNDLPFNPNPPPAGPIGRLRRRIARLRGRGGNLGS